MPSSECGAASCPAASTSGETALGRWMTTRGRGERYGHQALSLMSNVSQHVWGMEVGPMVCAKRANRISLEKCINWQATNNVVTPGLVACEAACALQYLLCVCALQCCTWVQQSVRSAWLVVVYPDMNEARTQHSQHKPPHTLARHVTANC